MLLQREHQLQRRRGPVVDEVVLERVADGVEGEKRGRHLDVELDGQNGRGATQLHAPDQVAAGEPAALVQREAEEVVDGLGQQQDLAVRRKHAVFADEEEVARANVDVGRAHEHRRQAVAAVIVGTAAAALDARVVVRVHLHLQGGLRDPAMQHFHLGPPLPRVGGDLEYRHHVGAAHGGGDTGLDLLLGQLLGALGGREDARLLAPVGVGERFGRDELHEPEEALLEATVLQHALDVRDLGHRLEAIAMAVQASAAAVLG